MKPELIHYIHGFKTALASILAYAITYALDLELGYWAVISTVIVMQVYVADSIEMCLYRLSGTVIGAVIGGGVMLFTPHTPVWIGIALFVTIGFCTFLTRYKTRYRMAAITLVIIVSTAGTNDHILLFAMDRVLEIAIGIVCAFGVSVLIFPRRKADMLKDRMVNQAKRCAQLCDTLVKAFAGSQRNVDEAPIEALVEDIRNNPGFFINIRRHETRIYKLGNHFQDKVMLMGRAVENLRTMTRILNSLKGRGEELIMSQELINLSQVSGKALLALIAEEKDCPWQELEGLVQKMEQRLMDIRKEGLTTRFDLKRLVQIFSFYNSLKYFAEDIIDQARQMESKV